VNSDTSGLLVGNQAIARFVFGDDSASNVRRVQWWIKTGRLPAGRIGKFPVADPNVITKKLAEIVAGRGAGA
jgi:hypothetical protein